MSKLGTGGGPDCGASPAGSRSKIGGESRDGRVLDRRASAARVPSSSPNEVTPRSAMPQGTIRPKWARSVLTLKREAVAGDPARDPHADGRQLVLRRPRRRSGPATRPASTPNRRGDRDHHLLEIAHVAVHVAAIGPQIEDRIADQLAGTVVGDVAAAARLEQRDARPRPAPRRDASTCERSLRTLAPSVMTGGC